MANKIQLINTRAFEEQVIISFHLLRTPAQKLYIKIFVLDLKESTYHNVTFDQKYDLIPLNFHGEKKAFNL